MNYFPITPPQPIYQRTPQFSLVLDAGQNRVFNDTVKSLTQIEKGQLQVMDKRATERLEPQYLAFLNILPWMHMNRIVFSEFQLNPYWNALIEIIGYFQFKDMNYVLANAHPIHGKIKTKLLKQCTAIKYLEFIEPIHSSVKHQKAVFKRCLDKHKQMNCLFFELQCNFTHPLYQSDEVQLPKLVRKWLERLHQSEQLAGKLYDVQWRIVKSVNGFYSVHAIMYVIGDECKYSDFILREWEGTCLHKGHELVQGSSYLVREKHCYIADSDMRSYWYKQIEFLNEPLKIYRYMSQHISYLWQSYTGNIPAK
ncbi:hypothetical protein AVENLUH5627_01906 [Acinetobacter venetianus]|uniref:Uncharacterized protein n=1 Tax=Acinetobacter venetianus TaxID=52133 RepID=A0A150HNX2_9GAMM|nr:hypothetical protein [Acinetobacter venetianus]KXZ68054.1 hypothetical protein AVENLUH5627_01906 [Acinetobacter venetianus]